MSTHFQVNVTPHAVLRIQERLNQTPEYLKSVIESFKTVRVRECHRYASRDTDSENDHTTGYLFYDEGVDSFFVAVFNDANQTLVTVLTFDQAKRSTFRKATAVSQLSLAIDRFNEGRKTNKVDKVRILSRHLSLEEGIKESVSVYVRYRDAEGRQKFFKMSLKLDRTLYSFVEDKVFFDWGHPNALQYVQEILDKAVSLGISLQNIQGLEIDLKHYGIVEHPHND